MAMIHEITAKVGKHKARKRIGRGPGSGTGKTAGRGENGAGSRAGFGGSIHPAYEGGQTPYFRRIPKRGFSNARFRKHFEIINLKAIDERFGKEGSDVNPETLVAVGLIRDIKLPVKILGEGELSKKLSVCAHRFSESARQKIESAGGTVTVLEK